MEDRYSVLVEFEDQNSAERFYADLNGWRFSTSEVSKLNSSLSADHIRDFC